LKDRIKILDIGVDAITREAAINKVQHFIENGQRVHSIFASNPEKNFSLPKNPSLHSQRLPGSDFIFDICELAARERYGVFFYGAREDINKSAVDKLKEKYPELNIVGRTNGYVSDSEMTDLIDRINTSHAQILFLALGSPRQEMWFATYSPFLKHVKVCQSVGGTLDAIAGTVRRAPEFWQKRNLEWFYRLVTQPSRIARQKVLPVFVFKVLMAKVKSSFN
jgi:N-acetylglucosaminyldiphosphoundecaprenol N-acetyl-beta-D-mannosaminyltransferase